MAPITGAKRGNIPTLPSRETEATIRNTAQPLQTHTNSHYKVDSPERQCPHTQVLHMWFQGRNRPEQANAGREASRLEAARDWRGMVDCTPEVESSKEVMVGPHDG